MFNNYLKIAWRNLTVNKVYSIISILGLAIGLAVSILIFCGVNDELTGNRDLPGADNIYRLNAKIKTGDNSFDTWTVTPAPISALALKSFPEVENAVMIKSWQMSIVNNSNPILEKNAAFTEPSFFSLFHILFIKGDAFTALKDPYSMVLSRDAAVKYFGSVQNATGKILKGGEKLESYTVSAVIENMPQQNSVRFDMLLSMDYVRNIFRENGRRITVDGNWGDFNFNTFFKLRPGTNISSVEKKLTAAYVKNSPRTKPGDVNYILQPLNSLHLYNPDMSPSGIRVVKMFLLTGILIIVIAVINYVNLSTARAVKRAKEVGLRRVAGAGRKQLLVQFIIEFILIFCIALVLAVGLLIALVPIYQNISGKSYTIGYWQWSSLKIVASVALSTIILASVYPARILSSFNPGEVLKTNFSKGPKGGIFRKVLVIFQFGFSISLIICTIIVTKQLNYIQQKNMGYNRENLLVAGISAKMGRQIDAVIQELTANKNITGATYASDNLLGFSSSTSSISWPGKHNDQAHIAPMNVAWNFTDLMGMKFVAGSGFTGLPSDSTCYLVNEAAVKMMGLKNPIGTTILLWEIPGQIKGVLKDFNSNSLKAEVQPAIFRIKRSADNGAVLYVKMRSETAREAVAAIEKICKSFDSLYPFEYRFMDQDFEAMYRREIQTSVLFQYFASIAVALSCMGLFGLSVFTAQRRTKEIGIRKVLGASVKSISCLISKEFIVLVVLANSISWPISWYFMNKWMEEFVYRTTISLWIFVAAGFIALVLALLTVSSQAMKVALTNPAKSLRTE